MVPDVSGVRGGAQMVVRFEDTDGFKGDDIFMVVDGSEDEL